MAQVLNEKIQSIERIAQTIFKMTIKSEYVAQNALPGQFVNVRCSEGIDALLRRPISICDVDKERNTFDIVFQLKGKGTEYLSLKKTGDEIDVIAPLGTPFTVSAEAKRIAVVGGGIGIFPLLYLLKTYKNITNTNECMVFLGFRNIDYVVLTDEFEKNSDKLFISSDDGTSGYKGLVTELLENELQVNNFDMIYTCGPTPMIKKVVEISKNQGLKCQVSLEQRMGCGIGACLVCACKTKLGDAWEYSHVCKDGPIFWSDEVIFED